MTQVLIFEDLDSDSDVNDSDLDLDSDTWDSAQKLPESSSSPLFFRVDQIVLFTYLVAN